MGEIRARYLAENFFNFKPWAAAVEYLLGVGIERVTAYDQELVQRLHDGFDAIIFIPEDERILVIEDTAELHVPQPNLVRFEARQEQNGVQPVAVRDLLKAALRHRPDRLLLGEIRGAEAFELLQLLNTGHSGTLSTVHASSAKQALARFTSCVLQSGVELPYRAIKTNIGDSVNVVIHLERRPGRRFRQLGRRRRHSVLGGANVAGKSNSERKRPPMRMPRAASPSAA